ncbi:polyprenol reductase-like [Lutzomyia longipalpis]|uniref:polyprenol reductase-like n=1 Tax=Lutzomyia longipalpis TaxID=7200 RepID=UPI00248415EC|nr:polyprenol reductase-like [Lutzomyia longipalpis]
MVCGNPQSVKTTALETVLALLLYNIHIIRRCYESFFVHIFSRRAKMSLNIVIFGNLFYILTVILITHSWPGFVFGTSLDPITLQDFSWRLIICSAVFIYAMYHQYQSHRILANLRLNKSGQVTSEGYFPPSGGYFELVSSPHMLFECLIYISLLGILWENKSLLAVTILVVVNQCKFAHESHLWYKENFPNYPVNRRAIIPFLI